MYIWCTPDKKMANPPKVLWDWAMGVDIMRGCTGVFPRKEDGMQVFAGLAPSNQTVGLLLRTPWPANPAGKNDISIARIFNFHILGNIGKSSWENDFSIVPFSFIFLYLEAYFFVAKSTN
jgi:hypothetical protein